MHHSQKQVLKVFGLMDTISNVQEVCVDVCSATCKKKEEEEDSERKTNFTDSCLGQTVISHFPTALTEALLIKKDKTLSLLVTVFKAPSTKLLYFMWL